MLEASDLQRKYDDMLKHDVEHEQLAIGCMVTSEFGLSQCCKLLKTEDFAVKHSRKLFNMIRSSYEQGDNFNDCYAKIICISESDWKAVDSQMPISRAEYVRQCLMKAMNVLKIENQVNSIIKRIKEQSARRYLCIRNQEFMEELLDTTNHKPFASVVNSIMEDSKQKLEEIADSEEEEDFKTMALRVLNTKEEKAISTGFKGLDHIIDGFKKGQLITIGAGTGIGKSAFAVNLAINIIRQGHGVALWSFEMDEREVLQRLFSVVTRISQKKASSDPRYGEERYNGIMKFFDEVKHGLTLRTKPIKDLGVFYLDCQKGIKQKDLKVVIIDYLQLIHLSRSGKTNRVAEIEYITNNFKNIANELGVTIIILSQLSREHTRREDKTPILSDLRDSGSIEQDSNVVMFLGNLDLKDTGNAALGRYDKPMCLWVAKNRSGSTGAVKFKYIGYITEFTELVTNNDNAVVAC